jgi:hypothetical protein
LIEVGVFHVGIDPRRDALDEPGRLDVLARPTTVATVICGVRRLVIGIGDAAEKIVGSWYRPAWARTTVGGYR